MKLSQFISTSIWMDNFNKILLKQGVSMITEFII